MTAYAHTNQTAVFDTYNKRAVDGLAALQKFLYFKKTASLQWLNSNIRKCCLHLIFA